MHDDDHEESELRVLRERVAELEELLDQLPDRAPSGGCAVVTVTGGGGASPSFFTVQAQTPGGIETEGGHGSLSPAGQPFFALGLGVTGPPTNTPVIARECGGRWVFRYG